ncbi:hypothetical protein GQ457_08G000500 [Hibiscus cannabinus]
MANNMANKRRNHDASFKSVCLVTTTSKFYQGIAVVAETVMGKLAMESTHKFTLLVLFVVECLALRLGSSLIKQHSW